MRKLLIFILIFSMFFIFSTISLAEENREFNESGAEVVIIQLAPPTPTPVPIPAPTPEPAPTPDPADLPCYSYDEGEARCLSRAMWSITGKKVPDETKIILCEVIQNRVDYEGDTFPDSIRYVLLQGKGTDHPEFGDYDPEAHRSEENDKLADYVMRTWIHSHKVDRSYRIIPKEGVRCQIYKINEKDYIKVYDINWNLLYDNGEGVIDYSKH